MEFSQKSSLPNPMASASFFSRLTFWWLNPLFGKGYDRRLEPEDMYEVLPEDSAEHLVSDFESEWQKEQATATFSGRKPSLEKAAARFAKRGLILVGLFGFLNEAVRTAQPLLLFYLVSYFTPGSSITKLEAYLYAMGVTLASVMSVILHQLFFFYGLRTGMQLRIATSGCVYRKALRLGQGTYASVTTGHVVNLLSSDAQRFNRFVAYVHFVWITPVQMVVTMYLLWQLLGVSCLVGLAVMLLMILYQARLGRVFAKLRLKTARLADTRCKYLNEILSGMRVVKISTLETSFSKLIHQIRRSEIGKVRKTQFLMAFNKALEYPSQCIVSFITFTTYVMLGNPLTAAVVFSSIAFLNALQRSVAKHFPPAVQMLSETKITLKRIKAFLELDELSFERVKHKSNLKSGNSGVVAKGITASWNQEGNGKPTLQDISFEAKKGDLLMVVGPVGCGKSSLLMTMLGELQISAGNLSIKGKIGYAPQLAWVFSGSVRQNIVFGQPLEEDRYWRVIKACALEQDVELLPEGDLTLVGEKGLTLSGGQKARICLARAVYYEADVYLLDDPLSAVDVRVGRQLFDDCINGLISECPRILVTHQLQYLRNASEIIYLEEGKIGGRGSFTELASAGVDLVSLLSTKETYDDDDNDSAIDDDCEPAVQSSQVQVVLRRGNGARGLKAVNRWSTASSVDIDADLEAMANKEKEKPVIEPEARPRGNIPFSLYFCYFKAGASCVVLCALLVFFTTAQGALTLSDWWLSQWSSSKGEDMIVFRSIKSTFSTGRSSNTTDTSNSVDHHIPYIIMYGLLVAATLILSFMRAFLFFHVTVSSSKVLFNRMFDAVMRAPIYFFDTNPIGRILNRFSGDTSYMDNLLPETFFDFLQLSFMAVAVVIVNVTTMPFILVGLVPIALVFYCLRNYYIKTSREIKRLEATGRSPLLSHVTASLQGLTSIRAHNSQKLMMKEFNVCQDHHTEAWFLFICSSRWLAYRLDFLCLLFVFMASFTPVFMAETRDIDAGIVGLCLTYALLLTGMFQWCVRQSAEVENQMTAVERIIEHCNLEPEGEWSVKSFPPYWPELGLITAEGVSFKHHPTLPRVLKNVNFCIRPKEKVGIVGRTGAGKSSLLSAILRLAEPSSGTIRIDGIDITEIGLHDLRSKLSVIPQDPVLFSGTLRKNLDPFNQFGDSELWVALHEVQLKDAVCCLTGGLDAQLTESGSNFSVGQRQLICLARAILRGNRILIMDEATANVDQITDALIQETLRRKFRNCTVLTIAHRLKTIMDSDRVMVLESGRLKEFEEPHLLLQNKFCYFYRLVEQTGSISAAQLAEVARKAYELRHKPQTHDSVPDVVRTHLSSYIPVSGYTDLQLVSNL